MSNGGGMRHLKSVEVTHLLVCRRSHGQDRFLLVYRAFSKGADVLEAVKAFANQDDDLLFRYVDLSVITLLVTSQSSF